MGPDSPADFADLLPGGPPARRAAADAPGEGSLAQLFSHANVAIFRATPAGDLEYANPHLAALLGVDGAAAAVRPFTAFLVRPERWTELVGLLRGGVDRVVTDIELRRGDGESVVAELRLHGTAGADGRLAAVEGFATDVSETRRAHGVNAARLRLLEHAVTQSVRRLLQATLDEVEVLTGSRIGFLAFVDEDEQGVTLQSYSTRTEAMCDVARPSRGRHALADAGIWADCLRERRPVVHDDCAAVPHRRGLPPGHVPVTRELVVPVTRRGRIVAMLGVGNKEASYTAADVDATLRLADLAWDIAERKLAEEALASSERRLKEAQAIAHVGDYEIDLSTLRTTASDEYVRILELPVRGRLDLAGGTPAELLAAARRAMEALIHPEDRAEATERVARAVAMGAPWDLEYRVLVGEDRRLKWIRSTGVIETDDAGRPVRITGTMQDVTARRELLDQLAQSRKLEAVGRLAGGVAHEFNNILTVILGSADVLVESLAPGDERRADAEDVRDAAHRAATLTRQLLTFSRRQVLQPRVVDVNAGVLALDHLLRRIIGEDVELVARCQTAPALVRIDPGQLDQVIVNLALNSREAMPRGGRLTVETATRDLRGDEAARRRLPPGRYVALTLADTGSGMTAEVRSHAFEPFFTTKAPGRGVGLGLSTAYGIVTQAGGEIALESEPGLGTRVTLWLPLAATPVPEPAAAPAPPARGGRPAATSGTETILFVEDDPALRRLGERVLRGAGYTVLVAEDGEDALRLAADPALRFELLVTDVVMPRLGGPELAIELRRSRPGLPVVYMSGYTEQGEELQRGGWLLLKPYTSQELAAKVRERLEAAAAQSA